MSKNEFICDCNVIHENAVKDVKNSMPSENTFNNMPKALRIKIENNEMTDGFVNVN